MVIKWKDGIIPKMKISAKNKVKVDKLIGIIRYHEFVIR